MSRRPLIPLGSPAWPISQPKPTEAGVADTQPDAPAFRFPGVVDLDGKNRARPGSSPVNNNSALLEGPNFIEYSPLNNPIVDPVVTPTSSRNIEGNGPFGPPATRPGSISPGQFILGSTTPGAPAPNATSVSPVEGGTAGSTSITIVGSNLGNVTAVSVGGVACTSIVASSLSVTCVTGANTVGAKDVVVTGEAGLTTTLSGVYTYVAAPTVTSITPNNGSGVGNESVALVGTNFVVGATAVTIGGAACTAVVVASATSLTCTTPSSTTTGAKDVVATTVGGAGTLAGGYTYNSASTTWTPASITTQLWLDADDSATVTESSGAVSQWDDKSGSSFDFSQATGSKQPTYSATGFNSKGAITFDGSNDILRRVISGTSAGYWTGFAVVDNQTSATDKMIFHAESGNMVLTTNGNPTNGVAIYAKAGSYNSSYWQLSGDAQTGQQMVCWVSADNGNFYRDGSSIYSPTYTAQQVAINDDVAIGGHYADGCCYWGGSVAEFVLVPTELSTADRQRMEGYLAWKWTLVAALPVSHPYKSGAPVIAPAPTITSITPNSGTGTGEASVTIVGSSFIAGMTVTVGGNACTSVVVGFSTSLTCNVPTSTTAGAKDVVVTTSGGSATLSSGFTYTAPLVTLWTPAELGSDVQLWLDAEDSTTITESSGAVSLWSDKSGNANNFAQGTGSVQPTTGVGTLGGINVVRFDSDFMATGSAITGVKAAVFVCNNLNGGNSSNEVSAIFSDNAPSTGDNYTFVRTNNTDYSISIDGAVSNTGNASENGEALVSGGNIDLGMSIVEKAAENIWYADFDTAIDVDRLADLNQSYDYKLKGDIAELVLLDAVPSTADRQKLEGYLAWKWDGGSAGTLVGNLPSGHPYKSAAPTV